MPADTSLILFDGMRIALDSWAARFHGERELLYWTLRGMVGEMANGDAEHELAGVPADLKGGLSALRARV
jgi:hypothetical protein